MDEIDPRLLRGRMPEPYREDGGGEPIRVIVAIPTYRRPALLVRAVRSVLRQTHRDTLVAVFDNCSGDDTGVLITELARGEGRGRVIYFCHPENLGMAGNMEAACRWAARNAGYWSLLCDDDVMLPDFVTTALQGFAQCPAAAYSAAATPVVKVDGCVTLNALQDWPTHGVFGPGQTLDPIFRHGHPMVTAMLWRDDQVETVLRHIRDGSYFDVVATLEANLTRPVVISPLIGGLFVDHGSNISADHDQLAVWEKILVAIADKAPEKEGAMRAALRARQIRECRSHAIDALCLADASAARRYIARIAGMGAPISAALLSALCHVPTKLLGGTVRQWRRCFGRNWPSMEGYLAH